MRCRHGCGRDLAAQFVRWFLDDWLAETRSVSVSSSVTSRTSMHALLFRTGAFVGALTPEDVRGFLAYFTLEAVRPCCHPSVL